MVSQLPRDAQALLFGATLPPKVPPVVKPQWSKWSNTSGQIPVAMVKSAC